MKDEESGNAYDVVAHDISLDPSPLKANVISVLMFVAVALSLFV